MTENNTILDIPIKKLGILENLSKRTINVCLRNGIRSLSGILNFHWKNSGFLSLKNIGVKSNNELLKICSKYYYHPDFSSFKLTSDNVEFSWKIKLTVSKDLELNQLSEIEEMNILSINICKSQNITSLSSLLHYYYNNKKDFLSIRNCGKKTNKELVDICLKYESYIISIENPPEINVDDLTVNDELEERQSPTDEFLTHLKLDTSNFDLIKQNIVGFDPLPIFKIFDLLIDSDFIFQSKHNTKIFKETFNCYQDQDDYTLERIGKKVGLTRERIRQIRESILRRLNYGFKRNLFSGFHSLFLGYIDSVEQPYIFVTDEETQKINNNEGTRFSTVFITYLFSLIFFEYFKRLGDLPIVFGKNRSKKSFHINHLYLINLSISKQFKFEMFIKYMESLVEEKHKEDIYVTHKCLFNKFKTSDVRDTQSVIKIINLILENDFNSIVEITPDGFCLPSNRPPNLKSLIFEILKKSDNPLHFTEIQQQLLDHGHTYSEMTVHHTLINESTFGLKGSGIYDLRSKGGLFGSIGDVTEKILLKRGYGIYYTDLKRILMTELVISEHSINSVLFLYDIKKRFIKSGNQVLLSKWVGRGQLSLDFE